MRAATSCFACFLVVTAASLGACSSNTTIYRNAVPDGGTIDGDAGIVDPLEGGLGVDAGTDTGTATSETNPYGRPYPTANIGWRIRSGSTPGSVIANLKLTGYEIGSTTSETIPLAFVYDPDGQTHDIVALLVVAAWDTYSKQLAQRLTATAPMPVRVATMSVLAEGPTVGSAPSATDFDAWRLQLKDVIHVTDPQLAALKPLGELATAFPSIVILDARTMEIVSADLGLPADPKAVIDTARGNVKSRAPSY